MLKNMTLQARLVSSFLLMGGIVFAVGVVGWRGSSQLTGHLSTLSDISLPSIHGLWKINEGKTQIQSAERGLINPESTQVDRQNEIAQLQAAWQQIQDGFVEYDKAVRTEEEDVLYAEFQQIWAQWKAEHESFLQAYQEFERYGIPNPEQARFELLQNQATADELATVNQAYETLRELQERATDHSDVSFDAVTASLLQLIELNQDVAAIAQANADRDVRMTTFWILMGMTLGPAAAVLLGLFLSNKIAKPLSTRLAEIVNAIASSSTEIATTVAQQERTASQQATSVNQTTTTMDELGASSKQSAEQAEFAASGAQKALSQAENGSQAVQQTLNGMNTLKQKVEAIAQQILRLSEQTHQISGITGLVSDLANQTNMLALNAAVEAARAGDQGRGFAVVAVEIRKLADQSKKSAEKINALVGDIQTAINSTVMVTDEGTKTVDQGIEIAENTAAAFTGVTDAINNVFLSSQQISLNAKQQAIAIQQVVDAMNSLNVSASETASGISQTRMSTQNLSDAAQSLQTIV